MIEQTLFLVLMSGDRHEALQQTGAFERKLALAGVQIEHPALIAGIDRCVAIEDRGAPAMTVEDIGEGQPSGACAHDGNAGALRWSGMAIIHRCLYI
ncbi:hypothetical protein GCM10020258_36390 [Sphingomonas yabuuchiae]